MEPQLLLFWRCRWCGKTYSTTLDEFQNKKTRFPRRKVLTPSALDEHQCSGDDQDGFEGRLGVADLIGTRHAKEWECPTKE